MNKKQRKSLPQLVIIACYLVFLGISFLTGFEPGKKIGVNFYTFASSMLSILPCAFLLIALFDVWIKPETIEKYFGAESGLKGYLGAILLAGTAVGGLYVALPAAYSLQKKGAHLSALFTYLGASAICRIPMATYEASFLGLKFTAIRLIVSLPLVVLTSMLLGKYLTRTHYTMQENT
jgi:uncharacterized membrane protein YraQ (UPF0718 family)